jgi:hypothetical protein
LVPQALESWQVEFLIIFLQTHVFKTITPAPLHAVMALCMITQVTDFFIIIIITATTTAAALYNPPALHSKLNQNLLGECQHSTKILDQTTM